jgi:membrane protease YdiL (CAAX protease family)
MNYSTTIWILVGVSFSTYFILSLVYKKLGIHNLNGAVARVHGLTLLNLKHLIGIVLFGFLFYFIVPDLRYLIYNIEFPRLQILLPFLLVISILAYLSYAANQKDEKKNREASHYNFYHALQYLFIRFTFLFFYEFFFRGVLFFSFLDSFGVLLAIVFSTMLYVIIHFFDSKKELIGTVPFGIVLCLFTYFTNSIWYAFLIHLTLSAVYEISIFFSKTNKILKS